MSGSLQRRKKSKRKWKRLWFLLKDKVLYTFTAREVRGHRVSRTGPKTHAYSRRHSIITHSQTPHKAFPRKLHPSLLVSGNISDFFQSHEQSAQQLMKGFSVLSLFLLSCTALFFSMHEMLSDFPIAILMRYFLFVLICASLCFLQDKVASESLPLQGFTVKLTERPEGEESSNVFHLYHKRTLYYTFRADDQHTARRSAPVFIEMCSLVLR